MVSVFSVHIPGIVRGGFCGTLCNISTGIEAISFWIQHSLNNTYPVEDNNPRSNWFDSRGDVRESPAKTSAYDSRNAYKRTDTILLILFSDLEILDFSTFNSILFRYSMFSIAKLEDIFFKLSWEIFQIFPFLWSIL